MSTIKPDLKIVYHQARQDPAAQQGHSTRKQMQGGEAGVEDKAGNNDWGRGGGAAGSTERGRRWGVVVVVAVTVVVVIVLV